MSATPAGLCQCGCGQSTRVHLTSDRAKGITRGGFRRFVLGHASRKAVVKGYRLRHGRGEHVVIAERALGRPLPQGAVVHHADRNRSNNAHQNLVICESQAYHRLLHQRMRVRDAGGNPNAEAVCYICGMCKPFAAFYTNKRNKSTGVQSSCRICVSEYHKARNASREWAVSA